ncbi:MAG: arylsulfatase [Chthoniobacter sp.]|jgi:arylsulfatase A-like enzyme|nr:arylsulfatase [Chthoniobacter sp.]
MTSSFRFFVVALLLTQLAARSADPVPPNIVFILADDLGINDLACYGREDHHTPNLDRLAEEGMRFTTAYAAQPLCSPTRAAILTGKTPARLRLTTFLPGRPDAPSQRLLQAKTVPALPLDEKTIAELLKPAGYVTGCFGKWHLGGPGLGPKEQGFDWAVAGIPVTTPSATEGGKGEYALTEAAEQFIDAAKDRPFFLYLAHDSPHVPLAAKPELIEKYPDAFNPIYAAMIETLDDSVGRIMAKLDAFGLTNRTLFIFTSDNGGLHVPELPDTPATHNSPFRAGKGFLYEGGLRVPLLVRWPGKVVPGTRSAAPVISTDWLPTWLEAAGLPAAPGLDGVSLLPLLTGGEFPARALYWHFPHYSNQGGRPGGAIRSGDWKLIEHYENGRAELFNLASDPSESTDLSAEEPDRAGALRGQLAAWRQSVGAAENPPNPRFDSSLARALYEDVDVSNLDPETSAAEVREPLTDWRTTMDAVVKSVGPTVAGRAVIVLPAREAKVRGTTLRYEAAPERNVLGSWTKAEDWVGWNFDVKTPGEYAVELLLGCGKGGGGSEVVVSVGAQSLTTTIEETGHGQNLVPYTIGRLMLAAGKQTLAVKPISKAGDAVMELRQVVLVPITDPPVVKEPVEPPPL